MWPFNESEMFRSADQGWTRETMEHAVEAIINGGMGYRRAAAHFRVPRSTLGKIVKSIRMQTGCPASGRPQGPIFSPEEENLLVEYILGLEERLFLLSYPDLMRLAYQLAEKLGKRHNFCREKGMAHRAWFNGFRAKHPDITTRIKPTMANAVKATSFNRTNVAHFFSLLTRTVDELELTPDRLYTCGETAVVVGPQSNIMSLKGRMHVEVLSSEERGDAVTVHVCFNAVGSYMPPLFVFPVEGDDLMNGCPPDAWSVFHPSGSMQSDIFLVWFKKFIAWTGATEEKPVLLLLNGYCAHTKNLAFIDLAKKNGVELLCFPADCSHRLHPVEVSFIKSLGAFYSREVTRLNPEHEVSVFKVAELYGQAFVKTATLSTAAFGFRFSGIWPVNPDVFSECDYTPETTIRSTTFQAPKTSKRTGDQDEVRAPLKCPGILKGAGDAKEISSQPSLVDSSLVVTLPEGSEPRTSVKRRSEILTGAKKRNEPNIMAPEYANDDDDDCPVHDCAVFGQCVGLELDIVRDCEQNDIAKKLISDVLFLAKRAKLTCDSYIQTGVVEAQQEKRSMKCEPISDSEDDPESSPPTLNQSAPKNKLEEESEDDAESKPNPKRMKTR